MTNLACFGNSLIVAFLALILGLIPYTIPFMNNYSIVIDTNIFISALLSQQGTSYQLLMLADQGRFEIALSVPLVIEYEDAANRILHKTALETEDLKDIIDYLCTIANRQSIYYLWRPFLRDPQDDMVLELAVAAQCEFIISFNQRDFIGVEEFGITVVTPFQFLRLIGALS